MEWEFNKLLHTGWITARSHCIAPGTIFNIVTKHHKGKDCKRTVCVQLSHFAAVQKINNIVNQLYFSKYKQTKKKTTPAQNTASALTFQDPGRARKCIGPTSELPKQGIIKTPFSILHSILGEPRPSYTEHSVFSLDILPANVI